jgi:hypothetical protein
MMGSAVDRPTPAESQNMRPRRQDWRERVFAWAAAAVAAPANRAYCHKWEWPSSCLAAREIAAPAALDLGGT